MNEWAGVMQWRRPLEPSTPAVGLSSHESRADLSRAACPQARLAWSSLGRANSACRGRTAQLVADHVIESTPQYVLALETARQKVGPHEPLAQCEEPVGEDKVVISPTAAVQPLAIPAHGRVEGLHEAEQGEKDP